MTKEHYDQREATYDQREATWTDGTPVQQPPRTFPTKPTPTFPKQNTHLLALVDGLRLDCQGQAAETLNDAELTVLITKHVAKLECHPLVPQIKILLKQWEESDCTDDAVPILNALAELVEEHGK